jgi:hypothetical protein
MNIHFCKIQLVHSILKVDFCCHVRERSTFQKIERPRQQYMQTYPAQFRVRRKILTVITRATNPSKCESNITEIGLVFFRCYKTELILMILINAFHTTGCPQKIPSIEIIILLLRVITPLGI